MQRAIGAVATLVTVAGALTACSFESLGMGSEPRGAASRSGPSRAPAETDRAGRTGPRLVRGDLAAGTVTHTQQVGTGQLAITYWTTRNVGTWTAATAATVQMSARMRRLPGAAKVPVFVTGLTITYATNAGRGTVVLKRDAGRFVVAAPFSYGTAVVVPGAGASVRSAHLDVQLDLLIATSTASRDYVRQTVVDNLNFSYQERPA